MTQAAPSALAGWVCHLRWLFWKEEGRPWRLVFGVSLLSGVAQIAILREISALHALSSLRLSIRLVIGVVLVAYGVGAALAPVVRRLGENRCFALLGVGLTAYLLLLMLCLLVWLEPQFSARAVDPLELFVIGLIVSPPFVAYALVVAHLAAVIQTRSPEQLGAFVAVSLLGTLTGLAVSHHYAQWIGVNSLLTISAVASLPVLMGRHWQAVMVAVLISISPIENYLESQRRSSPGFVPPVTTVNTTRVYSGWSPYQKIDLYTFKDEVLLGVYNGFWEWWVAARTDHPNNFPGYPLLYDPVWVEGKEVLVIGSGAGMGLLHLEESRPQSITAVELDPLVVRLSRSSFSRFNQNIYERVPVYVMEGRSFLESTRQQFDLILYEGSFITRPHPQVAVGAENYLYTREGIATALERLRPGGLGMIMFAGPHRALQRVRKSIEALGAPAKTLWLSFPGTLWRSLPVIVFGHRAQEVLRVVDRVVAEPGYAQNVEVSALDTDGVDLVTDSRPFLYAGEPRELYPLLLFVAGGGVVLVGGLVNRRRRRFRAYYFLVGVAFMLVQYGILSHFRSFFGNPVTTAYTILLLLLAGMALGSARATNFMKLAPARRRVLAVASVGLCSLALTWLPLQLGLSSWLLRLGIATVAVLPLGVLLGVFFPLGLRGETSHAVPWAYVWDALGGVVGFFLFYLLALPLGIPSVLGVGALAYAGAWAVLPRA